MELIASILLGCAAPEATEPAPAPDPVVEDTAPAEPPVPRTLLSAVEVLERVSLDLRGARPTIEEIERVEADPAALDALIEELLLDPRFPARIRDLWSTIYLTRSDYFYVGAEAYGQTDEAAFARAVGEEPLYVLSQIVAEDLPYTDIVMGDWSMADETIGRAWSTDYPTDATGWRKVRYTDGRPAAGVLATNGLWWRYGTNESNANRGRANAISRILLCEDYLAKGVSFDRNINLLDQGAVNDALRSNPGCVACHATLDPFASYLWGFYYIDYDSAADTTPYHPEREPYWTEVTEVAPGYYGVPGYDLADLGRQIAADPRLPACVVDQARSLFVGRDSTLDDTTELTRLREVLLANDLRLRPLISAVVASDDYRAASVDGGGRKLLSSDQLSTVIEDLTGYRFTYGGYDMLATDEYGLRTLAGGVDGVYSTRRAATATATMALVLERVSQAAASHVVEADQANPSAPRLFTEVALTATPQSDPEGFARQVQALHLRIYGKRVAADGAEVAANAALWTDLYTLEGSGPRAWAGLLSVLLRDPDFLFY